MRNTTVTVLLLLSAAVILPSCSKRQATQESSGSPVVFVSLLPQKYLVHRIANDYVDVEVLVSPGQEPHTFEPTPQLMTRLSEARVLFTAGVPFENTLVPKLVAAKQLRVVDATQGITRIASTDEDEPGLDPHTWTSPRLAKMQAQIMYETLAEIDPAHKADFGRNLKQLDADLDALDAQIAAAMAPLKGKTFFVFHPAFGYFARDYGLKQEAVETGGREPSLKHVQALIDKAKSEGVRVIFVQPQFSQHAAASIAQQIGGVVVPIDPLAEDYIANLQDVARKIHDALTPTTSASSGS